MPALPIFEKLHSRVRDGSAFLYAFDLLEQPVEARKAALARLLEPNRHAAGIHLVEHMAGVTQTSLRASLKAPIVLKAIA